MLNSCFQVFRLQSVYGSIETETQCKESVVTDLRKQIREADDALSAAVAGNEHLRCQMEEQRLRFGDMNECELARLRNSFEDKVQKLRVYTISDDQKIYVAKALEQPVCTRKYRHWMCLGNRCGLLHWELSLMYAFYTLRSNNRTRRSFWSSRSGHWRRFWLKRTNSMIV